MGVEGPATIHYTHIQMPLSVENQFKGIDNMGLRGIGMTHLYDDSKALACWQPCSSHESPRHVAIQEIS